MLIATISWKLSRGLQRNLLLINLIYYFIFIKIILYYCIPTVLRIYSDYQFEAQDGVSIDKVIEIYAIENISWIFWTLGLYLTLYFLKNNSDEFKIDKLSKNIILIICFGYILTQIIGFYGFDQPIILEPFKSLFYFGGLVMGPFLVVISRKYLTNLFYVLGIICLIISLATTSTRGILIYALFFILFLSWHFFNNKKIFFLVIIILFFTGLTYFLFGGLVSPTFNKNDGGDIVFSVNIDTDKKGDRSSLDEIEWRFGAATRMGTAFIDLYDNKKSAGLNPILHSLQGIIPRSIMPDKPHPSTLDGDDIYSQGMYIIYREIHGYNNVNMVEFPTGAHFYWEFGYLGVILFSILSGLYIAISTHFYSKLGIISIPLTIILFKPWGYMEPKIWISDAVMQVYQIALPLIFIVLILNLLDKVTKIKVSRK